jgi:hypothetical protein
MARTCSAVDGRWKLAVGSLTWDKDWRRQRYNDYARRLAELRAEDGGARRTSRQDALLDELIRDAVNHVIRAAGAVP